MKTLKTLFGLVFVLSMLIAVTSCDKSQDASNPSTDQALYMGAGSGNGGGTGCSFDSTAPLTVDEVEGLLFMREEEKLAHDVYVNFFALYAEKIFDNISASEQRHTDAALALINFYGLTDPALPTPGNFSDPALQTLYNDMIAQGSTSVEDALGTGALIEEVDIIDLEDELAITTNPNLVKVYGNLLKGSHNHLRAFVRVLNSYSITYQPQLLDTAAFNLIINTQNGNGNGNGNCGNGNGSGNCGNPNCGNCGNGNGGGNGGGNGNGGNGNGGGNGGGGNGNGGNGGGGNGSGGNGGGGNGNGGNGGGGNGSGGNGGGGNGNGGSCPNDTIN